MSNVSLALGFSTALVLWQAAGEKQTHSTADAEFATLRDGYVAKFQPLYIESERASWEASITGSDAAFARQRAAREGAHPIHALLGILHAPISSAFANDHEIDDGDR